VARAGTYASESGSCLQVHLDLRHLELNASVMQVLTTASKAHLVTGKSHFVGQLWGRESRQGACRQWSMSQVQNLPDKRAIQLKASLLCVYPHQLLKVSYSWALEILLKLASSVMNAKKLQASIAVM
jgi:hypothetical protein